MSTLYEYALFDRAFHKPLRFGNKTISSRSGIYLRCTSYGKTFISEASPLVGHSHDTLENTLTYLQSIRTSLWQNNSDIPPALQFALEGISAQQTFTTEKCTNLVKSNALVPWQGPHHTAEQIFHWSQLGYETFKVKIFEEMLDSLIPELESALVRLPKALFRLDGNRSLTPSSFNLFLKKLEQSEVAKSIEYIEEPTEDFFHLESTIPLAADESIIDIHKIYSLLDYKTPNVFILKPTVLGGLDSLSGLIHNIQKAGKKAVITSTLETEAGRRSIIAFLLLHPLTTPVGLSTGSIFKENFLPDQAVYSTLPLESALEQEYYTTLSWRELP